MDLHEVFCAVLYLLRTGCQWRFLPSEFPKWRTVHSYFAKWSEPDQDGISALGAGFKKIRLSRARRSLASNAILGSIREVLRTQLE